VSEDSLALKAELHAKECARAMLGRKVAYLERANADLHGRLEAFEAEELRSRQDFERQVRFSYSLGNADGYGVSCYSDCVFCGLSTCANAEPRGWLRARGLCTELHSASVCI
jgi:hypothetical protein